MRGKGNSVFFGLGSETFRITGDDCMAATLKDVARLAGFSVTTVSRALNGHSDGSEETRKKIREAAQAPSNVPNRVAQQLVMGKSSTSGPYSWERETCQNHVSTLMLSGLMDAATAHDW